MKKIIFGALLLALFSFSMNALAQDKQGAAADPVQQLTGEVWQQSKPENKRAVLFGIDTVVAIDKAIDEKQMEKGLKGKKNRPASLSIFEKKWMDAFKNSTREEIVAEVDKWYGDNPDQLNRPVMDVIWYEIIVPRTRAAK